MNVLGVKINSHDTGAAIISDGRVVAIAEERLCRIKHSFNIFPELSIQYCLGAFNLKPENIDLVVIDQVDMRRTWPMEKWFREKTKDAFKNAKIQVINHQDAHAASAFFCSPFEEAAILIYDGSGEKFESYLGLTAVETDTLYRGVNNKIYQIQKTTHLQEGKDFPYTYGIGKFYQRMSENYLGLGKYNEGKMMGLASYGTKTILDVFPKEWWFKEQAGHIICNARIVYPAKGAATRLGNIKSLGRLVEVSKNYARTKIKHLARKISKLFAGIYYKNIFFVPDLFPVIKLPRPARDASQKLPDDYYVSIAHTAQKILEEVAIAWGKKLKDATGCQNICIAGGVGLNIDVNKKFLDEAGFKNIFVQPGSSDTGVALGCALWGWHVILGRPRFWVMKRADLGRPYPQEKILEAVKRHEEKINFRKTQTPASETAGLLADEKIVGWFQGGAEYGPRALGNRSIICDPRGKGMKDALNNRVKHREPWRPFAASVLRERLSEWFDLNIDSPFMLLAADVLKEKREKIPAVTHVDGTCRIQTVTKEDNKRYYDLIKAFYEKTGVPLILNTSFNLAGEPIVETPNDALECFLKTEMDYLVLEDYVISKKN